MGNGNGADKSLSLKTIFETGYLRTMHGYIPDEIIPQDSLKLSDEERKDVQSFLKALENQRERPKKKCLPIALARELMPAVVRYMHPRDSLSIVGLLQKLSYQMKLTFREINALLGIEAGDVKKLKRIFVVDPATNDIDGGIVPLKKIAAALKLDNARMERMIYVTFASIYPEPINTKNAFDQGYQADHVNPKAMAITKMVTNKLFSEN